MSSLIYPLSIKAGDIVITDDVDVINRDAIESTIRTRLDERVRRPDYGRAVDPFDTETDLGAVARSIRRSIELSCPSYNLGDLGIYTYYNNDTTVVEVRYAEQQNLTLTL